MKLTRISGGLAVAALVAASCSGGGDDETVDSAPETTPTTEEVPDTTPSTTARPRATTTTEPFDEELPVVARQPLTGAPLADEDDAEQRPALAVKIDNHPDARENHSGLALADIVFEEKVEGSLTRFAAVFHTLDADPIGPIRSGRSQDVALLSSLNEPLFAWSGGNPGVTALIRASFLTDLNWQDNPDDYFRGPGRSPHNLYSTSETLYALTPDLHPGPPNQQFNYLGLDDEFDGDPAESVELTIGGIDIDWDWDDDTSRYARSQVGEPHVDVNYGQIGAENVVVLVVDYKPSSIDAQSPEAQTVGEGLAFVFTDGQVIQGTWSRGEAIFPFLLVDEDNEPISLTPGQTWVELAEVAPAFT